MPLIHGKSNKAFTSNIKTEMHAGKPQKQSLAIAYAMKRKAQKHKEAEGGKIEHEEKHEEHPMPKDRMDMRAMAKHKMHESMSKRERAIKMAEGGQITDNYQSHKDAHITHPDLKDEEMDEYDPKQEPGRKMNERAHEEDAHALNQHGEIEEGPDGPFVDALDHETHDEHAVENQGEGIEEDMVGHIMKQRQKRFATGGAVEPDDEEDRRAAGEAGEQAKKFAQKYPGFNESQNIHPMTPPAPPAPKPAPNDQPFHEEPYEFSKGGKVHHMCSGGGCSHYSHGGESHKHRYSEGGRVANQDEEITGKMPNEFDDEHLDDHLDDDGKANYSGANSGDELGDKQEDKDRHDIVSEIMRSRKKKDRMPRIA